MLNHTFRRDLGLSGCNDDRCSLYDMELRRFYVDVVMFKFSGRSDML